MTAISMALARRLPRAIAAMPFALAAVPLLANRPVMDRHLEPVASLPRVVGRLMLESVPANGVLYTAGDNDSFPLWYLQQVEGIRSDVLVVTVPLLGARWYREQLVRRDDLLPESSAANWPGLGPLLWSTSSRAEQARRPVRVSVLLAAHDREQIEPNGGWALEGLVYAPSSELPARSVGLALARMIRSHERIPLSALAPLHSGADPAAEQMQSLLRCAGIRTLTDTLLVGTCNGR